MDENQKSLAVLLESTNIAESLDEAQLRKIGQDAFAGYDLDEQSRQDWVKHVDEWTKLAKQTIEPKTYPWVGASNVKYPLLSTAAMQFAARAYPSLVPSNGRIVNAKAQGKDPAGTKSQVAEAVSIYMSYQIMEEMSGWEEDMDKLLIMLPIVGTMFKKTYWDSLKEENCSHIVMPKDLVINHWTRNLCDAERISEIIEMSPRKVKERQQSGLWLDIDLGRAPQPLMDNVGPSVVDETTPYTFIEQHTFLDLDEDGYKEPYIVTFHKESKKVVRIVARFDETTIKQGPDGKLHKIDPIQYYTKFGFVPNPDGGFYDIGFGVLLGPLNESVNTLINQLLDSGHLSTLQAGFIGKGLRIRMGDNRFTPGEWKAVNATGTDLKAQIMPLPTREPSNVLFQLMGSLISSGKELASVAEIFVGKMPGQNTPATTTMATVEQGMKVFTAVYKRIYRSLLEEFKKIFYLNKLYIDPNKVIKVLDMAIGPNDFDDETCDVIPGADPNAVTNQEKLMKSQGLLELLQMAGPILNPVEIVYRVLEAQEHPNIEKLFSQEVLQTGQIPQQPDPKLLAIQAKAQNDQQKAALDREMKLFDMQLKERDAEFQQAMKAEEHAMDMQQTAEKSMLEASSQVQLANIFSATERMKSQQALVQRDQEHSQKMAQQKEAQSLQKNRSKSGKPTR